MPTFSFPQWQMALWGEDCPQLAYFGEVAIQCIEKIGMIAYRKKANCLHRSRISSLRRFWTFLFVFIPSFGSSEVLNDPRLFGVARACANYVEYIQTDSDFSGAECHPLERFVIESEHLSDDEFIRSLVEVAGNQSALSALGETLIALSDDNTLKFFVASEIAGRQMAILLASSQDIERASFYSHVLYRVQLRGLERICAVNACTQLPLTTGIADIVGVEFTRLDFIDEARLLLCLARFDSFTIPIRELLTSKRLDYCIAAKS